jgi:hypothetical protein
VAPQIAARLGEPLVYNGRVYTEKRFRNCSATNALGRLSQQSAAQYLPRHYLEIMIIMDHFECILLASAALLFVALLTR